MKKENRQVWNTLILVLQLGINMLVPILLCTFLGVWIGEKTNVSWMAVPFFFVGALAGFTSVYKMIKKFIDRDNKG